MTQEFVLSKVHIIIISEKGISRASARPCNGLHATAFMFTFKINCTSILSHILQVDFHLSVTRLISFSEPLAPFILLAPKTVSSLFLRERTQCKRAAAMWTVPRAPLSNSMIQISDAYLSAHPRWVWTLCFSIMWMNCPSVVITHIFHVTESYDNVVHFLVKHM
jgi:hypothetical protein